jgi:excisionase family DNA binding protein
MLRAMAIADVSPDAGDPRTMPRVQHANLPWVANELTSLQGTHGVHADTDARERRGTAATTPAHVIEPAAPSPAEVPPATTRAPMLLTVRDLEAELQLGRTRTYELLRSGSIPVIRVGRALRVPRDALRRWVDEQTA